MDSVETRNGSLSRSSSAGSWSSHVREGNSSSPSSSLSSRHCARLGKNAEQTLPLVRQDDGNGDNSNKTSSFTSSKGLMAGAMRLSRLVRLVLAGILVLAACVVALLAWSYSYHVRHPAADPCQVARDVKEAIASFKNNRTRGEEFPSDWDPTVPKIIHHQWKDKDIPTRFQKWHNKWFELFPEPEYTHMLWTDETGRNLIKEHYLWFLETFDNYDVGIKRADATRYFFLHHYGGLHVDLDYEPMINFYQHLPMDRVSLVESPYKYNEKIQNSLMASPKGDPFWFGVFSELIRNHDKGVLGATGPQLMDKVMLTSKHPVHILPCENFHRMPIGESGVSPKAITNDREFRAKFYPMKQCGVYSDETCQFAKHHNAASYSKESEMDKFWTPGDE